MASHYQPIRIKSPSGHFLFLRSRYDPISGSFRRERLSFSSPPARPPRDPVGSACRTLIPLSVSGQRIRPHSALFLSAVRAAGLSPAGTGDASADLQGSPTLRGVRLKTERSARTGRTSSAEMLFYVGGPAKNAAPR